MCFFNDSNHNDSNQHEKLACAWVASNFTTTRHSKYFIQDESVSHLIDRYSEFKSSVPSLNKNLKLFLADFIIQFNNPLFKRGMKYSK